MKRFLFVAALAPALLLVATATTSAAIIDDLAAATLIANFEFDDLQGTAIEAAANSVDPAALFDLDTDFSAAATNGLGQYDGSGKDNTAFGTTYVDFDGITTGRVLGIFDVSWSFDESIYDPTQDEEFRLSLITNDPRSTFVTAETFFRRTSATEVTLFGNAVGTGAVDTADIILGSSGNLLTVVDADLDNDTLTLYTSTDGGASFMLAGSGALDPTRGVESARLVLNEDFSDDTLLVERFAVAVIPEPSTIAILAAGCLLPCLRRRV